jgi:hypothetical protein
MTRETAAPTSHPAAGEGGSVVLAALLALSLLLLL